MDGLRRSKRMRYSPLAWWRLEKVVYGRRESGKSLVPSIKEIHRIPQVKPEPLGARKKRDASRKKSRTAEPEPQQVVVYNPEEGWDDETDPYCEVLEYGEDGVTTLRRKHYNFVVQYSCVTLYKCLLLHRYCVYCQDGAAKGSRTRSILLPEGIRRRGLPRCGSAHHTTQLDEAHERHEG